MRNRPFVLNVSVHEGLVPKNDFRRFVVRIQYANPPRGDKMYAYKIIRVSHGLDLDEKILRKAVSEGFMDILAARFGDDGEYDSQPWRNIWTTYRRSIGSEIDMSVAHVMKETAAD